MPLVLASVATKLISKPETFSGNDVERPRWSLTLRAYLGAVSGRVLKLLRSAEDPEQSLTRVDLDPGDDVLDAQLYLRLTMLLKEILMKKVETVEYSAGLRLWRLLASDIEPTFSGRKMV